MLRLYSYTFTWSLFCLGLYFMLRHCDARAVNISNTWTMPQVGLNVFYRFFRDRISWFEADAVCQFHHANLVTVDNSFQFDATRDLLRELDVNDIVWIGLMRPQNSERFIWSNSKPLVTDAGYWAESLPLMDAPLCVVIDPIRDYRWHALRCGGPETASFLCELPVPNWAEACMQKDMPHITMQYMADTASIDIIRNCQEEGLMKATCKGKKDRDQVAQSLMCPSEHIEAQRLRDLTNSQLINGIVTDNNENNNIELLPLERNYDDNTPNSVVHMENVATEKNTVQKLIEQFNVNELMQADQPKAIQSKQNVNDYYKLRAIIPKPIKKSLKKFIELNKKDVAKQKLPTMHKEMYHNSDEQQNHFDNINDMMMMADQAVNGEPEIVEHMLEDVTNEITEPLPHIKKIQPQDLHTAAIIQQKLHNKEDANKFIEHKVTNHVKEKSFEEEKATTIPIDIANSTEMNKHNNEKSNLLKHKSQTQNSFKEKQLNEQEETDRITMEGEPQMTTTIVSITHPIHPQMQPHNMPSNESQYQQPISHNVYVKEAPDNSHFIPPMLLVKSHYIPNNNRQHASVHSTIQHEWTKKEASHDNNHQIHEANGKGVDEQFVTNVEQNNSMKMAERIFQDINDITTTSASAAAATTTKLIVNDYQQKVIPNFINVSKEKATNVNRNDHETNPMKTAQHYDDNNNSKNNNQPTNGIQEISTTLRTINSKTAQQKQQPEQAKEQKHEQQQQHEQIQEKEQPQEQKQKEKQQQQHEEQEQHNETKQLKLNKYEPVDNATNTNGKSPIEILLPQHQQYQQNDFNNSKKDNAQIIMSEMLTTTALTTDKMYDSVEIKFSQDLTTKSPNAYTNADKGKIRTMVEHEALTTNAPTHIIQNNIKQKEAKELLHERVVKEEVEEKIVEVEEAEAHEAMKIAEAHEKEKSLAGEKTKNTEELKIDKAATIPIQLQMKQQQQNVTPILITTATATTATTATVATRTTGTTRIEPSLDERIIAATQQNLHVTEMVTPTKQFTEMLPLNTMNETPKQIADKHEMKLEQKKLSYGITTIPVSATKTPEIKVEATAAAKDIEKIGKATLINLDTTDMNRPTEMLLTNEMSGVVDVIETTRHQAKIEERAALINITPDLATTIASEAYNAQTSNTKGPTSTPLQLDEISKSTTTTTTTTTPPTTTKAEAAALVTATATATATATVVEAATTVESAAMARNVEMTTRNFLKLTTEEPYKPNRRRTLTKPENVSYIKKILG